VVASFVVLFISLGTLLLAGLPLVTAILGVAIGLSAISALTAVTEINSVAPTLATMLGLAVGIDYAGVSRSRRRIGAAPPGRGVPLDRCPGHGRRGVPAHDRRLARRGRLDLPRGELGRPARSGLAGPIVSFLPVLMIAILFGLAMDYEVFLVSRMREG
jgi:uncharacterized membrane protein YdfJ with MMPL/SSD domain